VRHAGPLGFVWVRERDLPEVVVRAFQLFHSDVAARRGEFSGVTGRAGTLTSQPDAGLTWSSTES
jgi:FPC/CPF motif-containing protein YcgG